MERNSVHNSQYLGPGLKRLSASTTYLLEISYHFVNGHLERPIREELVPQDQAVNSEEAILEVDSPAELTLRTL